MCRVVDRDREIVRDHDFTVLYRSNSVVDHLEIMILQYYTGQIVLWIF